MQQFFTHLCCLLLAVLGLTYLTSCSRTPKRQIVYMLDIEQPQQSFSPTDWQLITTYLKSHDCPIGVVRLFDGVDLDDTDAQCEAYMQKLTSKLSREELATLGIRPGTSFTYSAWRYLDPSEPDKVDPITGTVSRVFIGRFRFP